LGYVRNLIRDTVGENVPAFLLPLAASIGFFILVANWLDFFPLQQPVEPANADLNLPLAMGLIVFLMSQGYAIKVRGLGGYLHHYLRAPYPPSPSSRSWSSRSPWPSDFSATCSPGW